MPRVWLGYDPQAGPEVRLRCRASLPDGSWGPVQAMDAIVDSGATRSSIRTADLAAIGLDADAATEYPPGASVTDAMGNEHPAGQASVLIIAKLFPPGFANGWGPVMRWEPKVTPLGVKAAGERLLGTRDFFRWFEVSFWHSADHPRLSLAY